MNKPNVYLAFLKATIKREWQPSAESGRNSPPETTVARGGSVEDRTTMKRQKYEMDDWAFIEIANDIRDIKNQLKTKIAGL
ncbi:MAG: hypothetical protein WCH86_02965 [Kiritimatiellales bacterium]